MFFSFGVLNSILSLCDPPHGEEKSRSLSFHGGANEEKQNGRVGSSRKILIFLGWIWQTSKDGKAEPN
jgi:hypothetical protein